VIETVLRLQFALLCFTWSREDEAVLQSTHVHQQAALELLLLLTSVPRC
jgi:hypothetical protein